MNGGFDVDGGDVIIYPSGADPTYFVFTKQ